jgi:CBS domain-containing membrane protein
MLNLQVRDVMTSRVFTVEGNESIAAVQDLMRKRQIRHVPVVDAGGAVIGVVSQQDVLQRGLFEDAGNVTDIMAWTIETIDADAPLSAAAQIMREHRYGCLPVVKNGVIAGILTEADFVKAAAPRKRAPRR